MTNVKRAVPLYKYYHVPREPLNDSYNNLLDPKTFTWQIELAHKYGMYGFLFYHYWFSGKILMKKPMEMFWKIRKKHPKITLQMFGTYTPDFRLPEWVTYTHNASQEETVRIYNSCGILFVQRYRKDLR